MGDEWNAPVEVSEEEIALLELCKKQKLWAFLRQYRHEILDGDVRASLGAMYKSGAKGGRPPVAPERLALAMLLQVGFGNSDQEVPMLTVVDQRWQMVLDVMGAKEPAFSQGTLFSFRERARAHGLMTLMLNKTVELARTSKGFDHKRLRALIDSSPLVGAGRVEDTFNLLGRALAQLVDAVAEEAAVAVDALAAELELSVVGATSIKAALDVDWRKPAARATALQALLDQFDRLRGWIKAHLDQTRVAQPPVSEQLALVEQIIAQDTEPDPEGPQPGKARRIREGVMAERLVSLSDRDMRHGRKSTTKTFNGYKRHVAIDADVQGLICAVKVVPANRPEHEAVGPLLEVVASNGFAVTEVHADRGYLPAEELVAMHDSGVRVICKPPTPAKSDHFGKDVFAINFDDKTVTCPANVTVPLVAKVRFPASACGACALRDRCTTSTRRCLSIHPQEAWYREMANELATPAGRALRRQRTPVEHVLAHAGAIQGNRARYRGIEKNQFDLERVAVLSNCFVLDRLWQEAA